jgi:hypothetical protein
MKKPLPTKLCAACGRPFAWRHKWARSWDEVKFCSDACRSGRRDAANAQISGRNGVAKPPGSA